MNYDIVAYKGTFSFVPTGIEPAAAVYAFMGWLASQEPSVGPFGKGESVAGNYELARQFCALQGWEVSGDEWWKQIKPWNE